MDCGPEIFLPWCHFRQFITICVTSGLFCFVFFFFFLFTRYSSNFKTSSAPKAHPYYAGWRFASVPCSLFAPSTPSTDTPRDAAERRGKRCTILSENVPTLLCVPTLPHTVLPCVHQDTEIISWWWHLHLIMLQSSLILWIQCLKVFSKIPSEWN